MQMPCKLGSRFRDIALAVVAVAAALPAMAQQATMSLEQVEREYRGMSIVHIEKCDTNGDGQFVKIEQLCVAGIYDAMYIDMG